MRAIRFGWLVAFAALFAAAGCGGGNSRGKNKDYDVPQSTKKL